MTGRADTAEPPLLHFYTAATVYSLPAHSYDSYDSYDFYDSYDSCDSCDAVQCMREYV